MALKRARWGSVGEVVLCAASLLFTACHGSSAYPPSSDTLSMWNERPEQVIFEGWITSLAFSGDGHKLVLGGCRRESYESGRACNGGVVQVVPVDGTRPDTPVRLPKGVTALAASPDGRIWVAGDTDGRLVRSSALSRASAKLLHQKREISAVAFSPDGKWVAAGSLDAAFPLGFMEVQTGGVVKVNTPLDPISTLVFSPDGKDLALGMSKGGVAVWSFGQGAFPIRIAPNDSERHEITGVSFSPDGLLLAYGRRDGKVLIVERESGQLVGSFEASTIVNALAFSPKGDSLALGLDNGKVLALESKTWSVVWSRRHLVPISSLAYSPDGALLAVAAQSNAYLYQVGEQDLEPTSIPRRAGQANDTKMGGRRSVVPTPMRRVGSGNVSSKKLSEVLRVSQREYVWLLPFDKLMVQGIEAMLELVPDATVEYIAHQPSSRLILRQESRSLTLDLDALRKASGRAGLELAVQSFEASQRFLMRTYRGSARNLEDAAIARILLELGPGLRLVSSQDMNTAAIEGDRAAVPSEATLVFPHEEVIRRADLIDRVPYLKLPRLNQQSVEEARRWVFGDTESRVRILDLRNNPGGDWESLRRTAAHFLPKGQSIAQVISRKNGELTSLRSDGQRESLSALVVLVNERTAGTAELLACAMQEMGVGVLVGSRTAGVDDVYTVFPLPDGSGLRVSTGRLLCPSGRSFRWEGQGVDLDGTREMFSGLTSMRAPVEKAFRPVSQTNAQSSSYVLAGDRTLEVGVQAAICLDRGRGHGTAYEKSRGRNAELSSLLKNCLQMLR